MSSSSRSRYLLSWPLLLSVYAGIAKAYVLDDLELHGFATQGFVKTSASSFLSDGENRSFEFTELGVNGKIKPTSDIRLSGQLLLRRAGEVSAGSPNVDCAVADMSLFSSEKEKSILLAGRVKNPQGFYYGGGYINKSDRDGSGFEAATGLPAHTRYHRAISFGVRWDLTPGFMLRAEY